jgi:hypothetical protein
MAFDINGVQIAASNTAIKITNNSIVGFDTSASYNIPILGKRPYFIATRSDASYYAYTSAAWTTMPFDKCLVNNSSCYNTTSFVFTAPISGAYYFDHSTYSYKADTVPSSYLHPTFWVNGSSTARLGSATTSYRLRARTYYSNTYAADTQINEILNLTAGDYVQVVTYSSGTTYWYGQYSHFTGYLIG